MASNCCSGNVSSSCTRCHRPSSVSSCGSSYPSNLVYNTTSCSPSTGKLESSIQTCCQDTCIEPINYQRSYVQSSPCQMSCGSSHPSNLVYSTPSCPINTCVDSTLHSGCQETCIKPLSCQRSCVMSSPCQTNFYYPRTSRTCSPCQPSYAGSLGFGSRSCSPAGYRSRSCSPRGCGSSSFRSLNYGVPCFPSLSYGSRYSHPAYFASTSCQPTWYTPSYGSFPCQFNC